MELTEKDSFRNTIPARCCAGTEAPQLQDLSYFRVATLHPAAARRALAVEIGETDVRVLVSTSRLFCDHPR